MESASTMCVVHNALLRGLNSIVIQAPNIQAADYKDFIGYSFCWYSAIHEHHTSEEDQFFPEIEASVGEKSLLDGNIQQHSKHNSSIDIFLTKDISLSVEVVSSQSFRHKLYF